MYKKPFPYLKFRFLWLIIGYSLVSLVVYLSLTSQPVELDDFMLHQDKLYHTFAYFVLMFWFAQLYHDRYQRAGIMLVFLGLGALMELLQGFDPKRHADMLDIVANATGVAIGFLLALTSAKNCLLKFEKYIA